MSAQTEHGPLSAVLREAAAGRFPPANGEVTVLPPPSPRDTHREAHTIDMLCLASPRSGQPGVALRPELDLAHPRIARAMRYRDQAARATGSPLTP